MRVRVAVELQVLVVFMVEVVQKVALVGVVLFVLFGPARLVVFLQLVQEINNELVH
jgi:hypothetical protein